MLFVSICDSLPWDQLTLWGYFGEITVSIFTSFTYAWFNATILTFFMAICWHHKAFNEILQHLLRQLNQSNTNEKNEQQIIRISYSNQRVSLNQTETFNIIFFLNYKLYLFHQLV